jgi:hypothetical protein
MKARVSKRAALERIRRRLRKENKVFHKQAGGGFITVDISKQEIVDVAEDLEPWAHDRGFLKPWEELAKDEEGD